MVRAALLCTVFAATVSHLACSPVCIEHDCDMGLTLSITLDDESPTTAVVYELSVDDGLALVESTCTYDLAAGLYDCDGLGWSTKQGGTEYGPHPPALGLDYETRYLSGPIGVYPDEVRVIVSHEGEEVFNELISPNYEFPDDFSRRDEQCWGHCRTAFFAFDARD